MRLIVILIFIFFNSITFSYINVLPTNFDKDITNGASEFFLLYNRTDMVKKYRIYLEDVPNQKSMTDWIEVYPKSIELKPQEQKEMRLYVETPKGTPEGSYYSTIVFKEINVPKLKYEESEEEKKQLYKIMSILKMRIRGKVSRK